MFWYCRCVFLCLYLKRCESKAEKEVGVGAEVGGGGGGAGRDLHKCPGDDLEFRPPNSSESSSSCLPQDQSVACGELKRKQDPPEINSWLSDCALLLERARRKSIRRRKSGYLCVSKATRAFLK